MKDDYFNLLGIKIPNKYFLYSISAIIPALILLYVITSYWGYEEIGRFGEKRHYATQYWIYLRPENAKAKSYRVKADIERDIPNYYLTKTYLPNGGYINFSDCQLNENDEFNVIPDEIYCISDDEDTGYYIRLDEKVK